MDISDGGLLKEIATDILGLLTDKGYKGFTDLCRIFYPTKTSQISLYPQVLWKPIVKFRPVGSS